MINKQKIYLTSKSSNDEIVMFNKNKGHDIVKASPQIIYIKICYDRPMSPFPTTSFQN